SAIAAASDRQLRWGSVVVRDQPLCRRDEVVEHILLPQFRPGLVPVLSVLAAAAEIGLRVHPSHLKPYRVRYCERRGQRDVETTIGVKQHRVVSIEFQSLSVGQKHRHPRAILARVEHLLGIVPAGIEVYLGLPELLTLACDQVIAINSGRSNEAREPVKRLLLLALAREAFCCPDSRQVDAPQELALQVMNAHLRLRILQVTE